MSSLESILKDVVSFWERQPGHRKLIEVIIGFDLAMVALALLLGDPAHYYFMKEESFINYLSAFQLLLLAFVSAEFYMFRRRNSKEQKLTDWYIIWGLAALGFLFLSFDEVFMIHENMDLYIHSWLGLEESALSDRLDDLIIACYGLIALLILFLGRQELLFFRKAFPYLKAGFLLLFIGVGLDALTNGHDIIDFLGLGSDFFSLCSILEETLELLAQCFFIATFLWFREVANEKHIGKDPKTEELQGQDSRQ